RAMKEFQCSRNPLKEVSRVPLLRLIGWPCYAPHLGHGREPIIHLRRITVRFPRVAPAPVDAYAPLTGGLPAGDVLLIVGSGRFGRHDRAPKTCCRAKRGT